MMTKKSLTNTQTMNKEDAYRLLWQFQELSDLCRYYLSQKEKLQIRIQREIMDKFPDLIMEVISDYQKSKRNEIKEDLEIFNILDKFK